MIRKLSHLLYVGTSFPYDVLVELFEDGDRNRKTVFNLRGKGRTKDYTVMVMLHPRNLINKLLTIGFNPIKFSVRHTSKNKQRQVPSPLALK